MPRRENTAPHQEEGERKHDHTKGKRTKSNTSPKKGGGSLLWVVLPPLAPSGRCFPPPPLEECCCLSLLSVTGWWVPLLGGAASRLLHGMCCFPLLFPFGCYLSLSFVWVALLLPHLLFGCFSPMGGAAFSILLLGGTASLSLQLCSCPKKIDVMDVYYTCRRGEEGKAPPPKRRSRKAAPLKRRGIKQHHPKKEEAKQHHPTKETGKTAPPKGGAGRQHHEKGGRGTTTSTDLNLPLVSLSKHNFNFTVYLWQFHQV